MKKLSIVWIVCILVPALVCAAEQTAADPFSEMLRRFVSGNLEDKIQILENASAMQSEDTGDALYVHAVEFVSRHFALIGTESSGTQLALAAIRGLQQPSEICFPLLVSLYQECADPQIRMAILEKIPVVAPENRLAADFVMSCITGELENPDKNELIIERGITAIGAYPEADAFSLLFTCYMQKSAPEIARAAENALCAVADGYKADILQVLETGSPAEKYAVFSLVEKNEKNSAFFKAEAAEKALSCSIIDNENAAEDSGVRSKLQLEAVAVLKENAWTRAAGIVVTYFRQAQTEFAEQIISAADMISVVQCLETLASAESGQALALYLGVLNSQAEQTGVYNEQLVLAVIQSLGVLGEKSAFDYLLYAISFSKYSPEIISAARDSVAKLKW